AWAAFAVVLAGIVEGGYFYVAPSLPPAGELKNVRLKIPLRIYSRDGRLIAQYGDQMRTPVPYRQIPQLLINAVLAAEDDRFFEHSGLDFIGTAHAVFRFVISGGERVPGGSTITQQVARTMNLVSRDFSLVRKFKEWILAFRLEREFTKQEILQLYLNTTFFGQRSYGVVAAARTYFGKDLDELTLSEAAVIAGIPQGPSIMNPISSPANARRRRAYVLGRMRDLGEIGDAEYETALAAPVESKRHGLELEVSAPYVAEMARAEMVKRFGQAAYTAGLRVTTTIDSRLQASANGAIKSTLNGYDERHGYRGPIGHFKLPEAAQPSPEDEAQLRQSMAQALADYPAVTGLMTGVVRSVGEQEAQVYLPSLGMQKIGMDAVAWARPYIDDDRTGLAPKAVSDVLAPGDIVRFRRGPDGALELAQLPEVQGAFVALDPQDGAVVALNGGYDFFLSNYNRATQALRQPGSSFKPFVYSAALEHGFTTATIVNDAPLTIQDPGLEKAWKPENYGNEYFGQVRLREALVHSLNAASVRVILKAGIPDTVAYMRRFGFSGPALPSNASLALGAGGVSPLDVAAGYAVFANGGRRITPYFIDRIEDVDGKLLYRANPAFVCIEKLPGDDPNVNRECRRPGEQTDSDDDPQADAAPQLIDDVTELYPPLRVAPRAITPQNAYLVTDMMHDVIRRGTGAAAWRALHRADLAGKTGTTNDLRDTWFSGFNADIVATAWVGFDQNRSLGRNEQGGVTAIPMWISFMRQALASLPDHEVARPSGIVDVRINPVNGLVADGSDPNSQFEKFRIGHVPDREPAAAFPARGSPAGEGVASKPPAEAIF
ncbi:MAG TPA: PBP1A family penicillin-binding protein, partial [Gammaproteobacteria bacterium]|nr:PBP1A family penicillin-binding protein [Gammaproteobacteria bacterium]